MPIGATLRTRPITGGAVSKLATGRGAERSGLESALTREDFEALLGRIGEGVTVRTPDGRIVYANEAAARLLGVDSTEEVLGSPMGTHRQRFEIFDVEGRLLDPADLPSERVRSGEDEAELFVRFRPVGGGEEQVALTRALRILDEQGGLRYVVSFFRMVTEEKAATEFVATVSHELRTPLAAIYGAAMTLRRQDVVLDSEQSETLLDVITSESDRLARTVNAILWASRLDTHALSTTIETCDPLVLAGEVVAAQRVHLPPRIRLEVEAAPELGAVAADPDKVRQVLVNLLDNAVKFSPDGGEVLLAIGSDGHHVRFAVSDQGLGIPSAEQPRIFDKFYRLDSQLTRGIGGTGLGLYICRELVSRMDGRIWVTSEPGRGSTFAFELPVAT